MESRNHPPTCKTKATLSSDVRGMGYIYLITNTVNGKKYVGQTQREDIETRWKQHRKQRSCGRCLLSAYKKYGIDKFKFQIICICFNEDCDIYETEYITKFNTLSPNGYNLEAGGKNAGCHPETRKLLSEKLSGKTIPDAVRAKISEAHKGEKNYNFGKNFTDEVKKNISNARKKFFEKMKENGTYDDYLKKRTASMIKNNTITTQFVKGCESLNKKSVGKYDKDDKLLEIFDSTVSASLNVGTSPSNISRVCKGDKYCKTAKGFIWKYM